jgi:hypothetical protein
LKKSEKSLPLQFIIGRPSGQAMVFKKRNFSRSEDPGQGAQNISQKLGI